MSSCIVFSHLIKIPYFGQFMNQNNGDDFFTMSSWIVFSHLIKTPYFGQFTGQNNDLFPVAPGSGNKPAGSVTSLSYDPDCTTEIGDSSIASIAISTKNRYPSTSYRT